MSRRRGIPGLSFSWRRAPGISGAKASLSRRIGIPLPQSGLERKLGRSLLRAVFDALFGRRRQPMPPVHTANRDATLPTRLPGGVACPKQP